MLLLKAWYNLHPDFEKILITHTGGLVLRHLPYYLNTVLPEPRIPKSRGLSTARVYVYYRYGVFDVTYPIVLSGVLSVRVLDGTVYMCRPVVMHVDIRIYETVSSLF